MTVSPPSPRPCLVALVATLLAPLAVAAAPAPWPSYHLTEPVLRMATDDDVFAPFARQVERDVERALRTVPPPDLARQKLLLGLRVHLALHFRNDAAALKAAEQIQALQTDPAERAHAGLTTRAIVEARHDPRAFEPIFTALLVALPHVPTIRAVLRRARDRTVAITEPALLAEVNQNLAPRLDRGEACTLEMADQLVRVHHRLAEILPLRDAMLRAYDFALTKQE